MINSFNEKTPTEIRNILTALNYSRRRVRIWYGDTVTGRAWNEEHDIRGTIGSSTGEQKIPLIIATTRSMGGPALLDHCIIRIDDVNQRQTLYKHSNFHVNLRRYGHEVLDESGNCVARFNHPMKADHYVQFMKGDRYKL
jgi:hypothetical protein